MRAFPANYSIQRPAHLEEAMALLSEDPVRTRPIAGGTDLMVLYNAGKLPPARLVDISRLPELRGIEANREEVTLGALTTYRQVQRHAVLMAEFPNLTAAAFWTGAAAIQSRGTLGGNAANASPAADSPPALLAYDAALELVGPEGRRRIPYREFHLGYKQTALGRGELIARIVLPRVAEPRFHFYRKVGTRGAQAISKVCLAACAARDGSVRLGWGAVAPTPAASPEASAAWTQGGQALLEGLRRDIAPIDDVRSNRLYRQQVAENLLLQCHAEWQAWRSANA